MELARCLGNEAEDSTIRTSKFTPESVAMALRQADSGTSVVEICHELRVAEETFYRWKKNFGGMGTPEIRELRQPREENRKLSRQQASAPNER